MDLKRTVALVAALVAGPTAAAAQFDAGIAVGTKAPVVSVGDLDGKPVDLGGYFGKKPVLIEFWATWCAVCRSLLPELGRVHQEFGDRISMIGINITVNDSKDRVRRYMAAHQPPFLPLYDDKGVSSRAFDVPTTSYIVIVDTTGAVAYTGSGEDQNLVAAVRKVLGR
ncbi:MAG: TlpA family protein disulfide reductase [Gemmatimonadales bacterium]